MKLRLPQARLRTRMAVILAIGWSAGCVGGDKEEGRPEPLEAAAQTTIFIDRAEESGLDFRHDNGMSGEYYMPELVGPGGALFDYDNDGDLDALLVQGYGLGPGQPEEAPTGMGARLYRNELSARADGGHSVRFVDVTAESGLDARGYGMGAAAADYDNDGWIDLYLTGFGSNQMWRNNADGTFTDVTVKTGTDAMRWSTSASFVDYDNDGWLDLYVANYVDFSFGSHRECHSPAGGRDYCGPDSYKGEPDRLFRNSGDGTFEDVSGPAGIHAEAGTGLGVVTADFDGDGRIDIYVANDLMLNILWHNLGDGRFENVALLSGSAVNMQGRPEASMGLSASDFDNDGDDDLFMTHLDGETNTVYENDGAGLFEDRSSASRLGGPSLAFTGFGTVSIDFNNDGWLDMLVVNGAVYKIPSQVRSGDPFPFKQPKHLFENRLDGTFADASSEAGAVFAVLEVSRGAAAGDVDNDGDLDVLVTNNNGPPRLLINQVGQDQHWLGLRLLGVSEKRDALGARVAVERAQGRTLWRRVATDGSYLSSRDPRILFGLGEDADLTRVRVEWPGCRVEEWDAPPIDRYSTLVEGTGRPVKADGRDGAECPG